MLTTSTSIKESHQENGGRFDRARILLAEDNRLNQEVVAKLLQRLGAVVQVASNGQEALNLVNEAEFDAVLMDVQMPVMGGYEASRLIRTLEKNKDLPIIAMTAHTMQGVKEDCLAAGMNDYIGKPIDPNQLFSVIAKWIKPSLLLTDEPEQRIEVEAGQSDSYPDLPSKQYGIDFAEGLQRFMGDRSFYTKFLIEFSKNYESYPQDIKTALDENCFEDAVRSAHTLKGIAGNGSAFEIQRIAGELETSLLQNSSAQNILLFDDLAQAFRSLKEFVEKFLEPNDSGESASQKTFSLSAVRPIIIELAEQIGRESPDSEKTLSELRKYIGVNLFKNEVQALATSINNSDFESAGADIQKIARKMSVKIEHLLKDIIS